MPRLHEALRQAVYDSGLLQCDLARHIGRHEATVSRYLSGEIDVPSSVMVRLAYAVGRPDLAPGGGGVTDATPSRRERPARSVVTYLHIYRQRRALAAGVPVECRARLYPDGRVEIVFGDDGPRDPCTPGAMPLPLRTVDALARRTA